MLTSFGILRSAVIALHEFIHTNAEKSEWVPRSFVSFTRMNKFTAGENAKYEDRYTATRILILKDVQ